MTSNFTSYLNEFPISIIVLLFIIAVLLLVIFRLEIKSYLLLFFTNLRKSIPGNLYTQSNKTQACSGSAQHQNFEKHPDLLALAEQMIKIEGGCFEMGDVLKEGQGNEQPLHEVWLSDYCLGSFLVSQKIWTAVMSRNPSSFRTHDQLPVENVSYYDVLEFIDRLNQLTESNYRLPSEAEWEFAARERGDILRFGNGKNIAEPTEINFNADISFKRSYSASGRFLKQTSPIGSYPPNALGLFDMSGNLFEWTSDFYHENGYQMHGILDPVVNNNSSFVVARGGSWNNHASRLRCTCRSYFQPAVRNPLVGFRLARSASK